MQNHTMNRVLSGLRRKREALVNWENKISAEKKAVQLGASPEISVAKHLETVDDSIGAVKDGTLGICDVCHEQVEPRLLEVDYTARVCLDHLSPQQVSQLENELELATAVQKALLPQEGPVIPGLEIAAYSRPAQFVGGDYFDFVSFQPDLPGLVIADIAGHGISASLQMASIQALSRALIPTSDTPAQAVERIHSLFVHNINFTTFVTLFMAAYDPSSRRLTYANGGHNPPLLLRTCLPEPEAIFLEPTGPAIGLIEDAEYSQNEVRLVPGDLFLMYTDGVIESRTLDGSMYQTSRLVDTLRGLAHLPVNEITRGIRESLDEFIQGVPLEDDVTFVIARVL